MLHYCCVCVLTEVFPMLHYCCVCILTEVRFPMLHYCCVCVLTEIFPMLHDCCVCVLTEVRFPMLHYYCVCALTEVLHLFSMVKVVLRQCEELCFANKTKKMDSFKREKEMSPENCYIPELLELKGLKGCYALHSGSVGGTVLGHDKHLAQ